MNALQKTPNDTRGRKINFTLTCKREAMPEPDDLIGQLMALKVKYAATRRDDDARFIQSMTGLRRASRSW